MDVVRGLAATAATAVLLLQALLQAAVLVHRPLGHLQGFKKEGPPARGSVCKCRQPPAARPRTLGDPSTSTSSDGCRPPACAGGGSSRRGASTASAVAHVAAWCPSLMAATGGLRGVAWRGSGCALSNLLLLNQPSRVGPPECASVVQAWWLLTHHPFLRGVASTRVWGWGCWWWWWWCCCCCCRLHCGGLAPTCILDDNGEFAHSNHTLSASLLPRGVAAGWPPPAPRCPQPPRWTPSC